MTHVVELLLQEYVALLYDDTYGSRTPSMDRDVFVKRYGLPLRRSIRFARKYWVVAALAHVARHVAKGNYDLSKKNKYDRSIKDKFARGV